MVLKKIGLNEKEAKVYLACLEYGPETISNLARFSGQKRPTLYNIVRKLLADGLLVLIRRNRRSFYDAEKPRRLLTTLRAREHELENALPQLEKIRNTKQAQPQVQIFEGLPGVQNVYDEVFEQFRADGTGHEVNFITSMTDLWKYAPGALEAFFTMAKNRRATNIRELIFDDEGGRRYVREAREAHGLTHQIRILPADLPVHNDITIYKGKVAFSSYKHRIYSTVFEDEEVHKTMKSLFEWAWLQGKSV